MIGSHVSALQHDIGSVHRDDGQHEYDLEIQNDVGVLVWPTFHFRLVKARDVQRVATNQEHNRSKQREDTQHLYGVEDYRIEPAERTKKAAVTAREAID